MCSWSLSPKNLTTFSEKSVGLSISPSYDSAFITCRLCILLLSAPPFTGNIIRNAPKTYSAIPDYRSGNGDGALKLFSVLLEHPTKCVFHPIYFVCNSAFCLQESSECFVRLIRTKIRHLFLVNFYHSTPSTPACLTNSTLGVSAATD